MLIRRFGLNYFGGFLFKLYNVMYQYYRFAGRVCNYPIMILYPPLWLVVPLVLKPTN